MNYFKISSLEDFRSMIKKVGDTKNPVYVDHNMTTELTNVTIEVTQPVPNLTEAILPSEQKFALIRVDRIFARIGRDKNSAFRHLAGDCNTRRAVIFTPDYNPDGPECVLACQVFVRDRVVSMSVYMRSSDLYYVFPKDLVAMDSLMDMFVNELETNIHPNTEFTKGSITFLIGSAHIYRTNRNPDKIPPARFFEMSREDGLILEKVTEYIQKNSEMDPRKSVFGEVAMKFLNIMEYLDKEGILSPEKKAEMNQFISRYIGHNCFSKPSTHEIPPFYQKIMLPLVNAYEQTFRKYHETSTRSKNREYPGDNE